MKKRVDYNPITPDTMGPSRTVGGGGVLGSITFAGGGGMLGSISKVLASRAITFPFLVHQLWFRALGRAQCSLLVVPLLSGRVPSGARPPPNPGKRARSRAPASACPNAEGVAPPSVCTHHTRTPGMMSLRQA